MTVTDARERSAYLMELARDACFIRDYDRALDDCLAQILKEDPGNLEALRLQADILYSLGCFEEAAEAFRRLRYDAQAEISLGWSLILAGETGEVSESVDQQLIQDGLKTLESALEKLLKRSHGQLGPDWSAHLRILRQKGYGELADRLDQPANAVIFKSQPAPDKPPVNPPRGRRPRGQKRHR